VAVDDHGGGGSADPADPAGPRGPLAGIREEIRRSVRDFSPDERKLLLPLAAAGFFEQYDVALLTLAATDISEGLGVSIGAFGVGVAIIRLGSLGGIPFMRLADRLGRRTLLIVSLASFTVLTGLTALAWSLAAFVVLQTLARVFLATEHNLASLVIAEEVRPDRRGAALSLMGWIATIGPGAVAVLLLLVPLTPLDWRIFYVFALLPLAIVAWLRRQLTETKAFRVAAAEERIQPSLRPHVPAAYRPDFRRICLFVSGFGGVLTPFFLFGADLAQDEYGWKGEFSLIVLGSGLATIAGFYVGGRLSDRLGRRGALATGHLLTAAGALLVFSEVKLLFVPGWFCAVGAYACLQAVVLAYLAELFPTELRATLTAFAISAQVVSGSIGLAIVAGVAELVDDTSAPMLGLAVVLVPCVLLLRRLPETAGRDVIALR
jgi:MFS transporter, AAHS family, 3-hydroxyphenylpropionic acid transporter